MSAREEVLARVRAAQAGTAPPVPRAYRGANDAPADLDLLVERLSDYRAQVHRCGEEDVGSLLAGLLTGHTVVPDGFPVGWLEGVDIVHDVALTSASLDRADAVVSLCALAIAETGTVVLDGGPGQGRRALSLVPDRHVLVVRAGQVVATVPQALARLDATRPQTWVSGPSATSDIELQRVEGVHGPRTLVVVLIDA